MSDTGKMIALIKALGGGGGSGSGIVVPIFSVNEEGTGLVCNMLLSEVVDAVKNGTCISALGIFMGNMGFALSIFDESEELGDYVMFQAISESMVCGIVYYINPQDGQTYIDFMSYSMSQYATQYIHHKSSGAVSFYPTPIIYDLGERATANITFYTNPDDSSPLTNIAYKFYFKCPSNSATSITFTNCVTATAGMNLQAGKTYVVDVLGGIAFFHEYEVTSV